MVTGGGSGLLAGTESSYSTGDVDAASGGYE
jgi:hypothetical protein